MCFAIVSSAIIYFALVKRVLFLINLLNVNTKCSFEYFECQNVSSSTNNPNHYKYFKFIKSHGDLTLHTIFAIMQNRQNIFILTTTNFVKIIDTHKEANGEIINTHLDLQLFIK